ncbi:bile acid:sodium symporter [bacterium]|nr:bile acid:sodium symporter [bacterium]
MSYWAKFLRSQWFSLALAGVFGLAWAWPAVGVAINPGNKTQYWSIVTIFLLSGLILPTGEAVAGLFNWRVHLFINAFQFVAVPLAAWLVLAPFRDSLDPALVAGFCLLATLPTTISSCVTFTQLVGGNVAASMFNAAAGNIAGIVITPALLFLMLGGKADHGSLHVLATIKSLTIQVVVPFAIGQVLHFMAGGRPSAWHKPVSIINSILILVIVGTAFSGTFVQADHLKSLNMADPRFYVPLMLLLPAHVCVLTAAGVGARLFGFGRKDRLAIFFTATQKTLALGLPMAHATLGGDTRLLGLAILPVIVYHPMQLIIAGIVKDKIRLTE